MSVELYEKMFAKMQAALLINESLHVAEAGIQPIEGKEFFTQMKNKYTIRSTE